MFTSLLMGNDKKEPFLWSLESNRIQDIIEDHICFIPKLKNMQSNENKLKLTINNM